jgi:hypothetical protein
MVVVDAVTYPTPRDSEASEWQLGIHAPVAEARGPVVVFGNAHSGSPAGYGELDEALAEQGVVAFMMDWPGYVGDIALRDDGRGVRGGAGRCGLR